jgi:hypothetical protein
VDVGTTMYKKAAVTFKTSNDNDELGEEFMKPILLLYGPSYFIFVKNLYFA